MSKELDYRIKATKQSVRVQIRAIRDRLDSLENALDHDRVLNDLGELQQLGPILDAKVAALATLQSIQQELSKQEKQ